MNRKPDVSKADLNEPVIDNLQSVSVDENPGPSSNVVFEKHKLLSNIGRWYTKQTADPSDRDLYAVTVLKELLIYVTFLIILCIGNSQSVHFLCFYDYYIVLITLNLLFFSTVAFGMTSNSTYYFRKAMSTIFIDANFHQNGRNFRKASQVQDFWNFAEKVLIDALYWDHWNSVGNKAETKYAKILYENELLGLPRLRQLRVRNDSCVVHQYFRRLFDSCYDSYSSSAEDKEAFGPGDGTAWRYHSPSELGGSSHTGLVKSYPPGGYYLDLYPNKSKTIAILSDLKKNGWIDRGTRVIFLDLTVYNANVNLFCIIKLVMEFPPTGGVVPSWSFQIVDLIRYSTSFDYFVLSCEVLFVLLVVFYTAEEIYEMVILKRKYLYILWSYVDLIILTVGFYYQNLLNLMLNCTFLQDLMALTISWASISMHLASFVMTKVFLKHLVEATDEFNDFESIGYWHGVFNNLVSLIVLFAWLKLFKYLGFNKTMTQLGRSLMRSVTDVAGFSVMFLIVFFAFVQLGYLLFSAQVRDFSTFGNSTFALLRIILGDFDFDTLQDASPVLGPIFFFCYVFFIFFILMNMFLAIINATYIEIKSEINARTQDFELVRYLKKLFRKFRTLIGFPVLNFFLSSKLFIKQQTLNLCNLPMYVVQDLCNFSDLEIEIFFAKYGLSGEGYLSEKEVDRMTADLYGAPVFSGK
ncbi:hypothetical protein J437_LFUL000358 [Ladona fulva]|uniref:Polycystic kidney disease 2-like 1 protein n=1 Tax=Ladona fulva TaxID=123851 RepID=A0A8K0NVH6_LADFU|nr:hypothetical protein J437_LFUL000358 [Ladona fulva]